MLSTHPQLRALGAKRNPPRDTMAFMVGGIPLPPTLITDISMLPRHDQGQQEACVGHAGSNMVNFDYWKKTGIVPNLSPRWGYDVAKKVDGDPTGDGTSAAFLYQGLHTYSGFATINTVPNEVTLDLSTYSSLDITAAMTADAMNYPVLNEVEVQNNITAAQLQTMIVQYGVVMIAVAVDQQTWMYQNGAGYLMPGNAGLHEIILYGYETIANDVVFHILNSWGANWGTNGTGKFLWSNYQYYLYDAMSITIAMNPSYTSAFTKAVNNTLAYEGGYTNDPNDPGGETNFGISKQAYPNLDIKDLTQAQAIAIYNSDFWAKIHGDSMPASLAMNVFDAAANIGVTPAVKMAQSALGVVADGVIGSKTLAAMAAATPATVAAFAALRAEYYFSLPQYSNFGKSWISRTTGTLVKSFTS